MAVPVVDSVTREMLCEILIDHCDSFVALMSYRYVSAVAGLLDRFVADLPE
jgi:hypothetical protein